MDSVDATGSVVCHIGIESELGLNSLFCCLYMGLCGGSFGVGESLRIWENLLESSSGLFIRTAGGDCLKECCGLQGGNGVVATTFITISRQLPYTSGKRHQS